MRNFGDLNGKKTKIHKTKKKLEATQNKKYSV